MIDAAEIYQKMRKSLGNKSYELNKAHIREITDLYLNFEENERSKIFDNDDFGYRKIIVERPLRLSCQFTDEKVASLRFQESLRDEMTDLYAQYGDKVYEDLTPYKEVISKHWEATETKITPANRKKLLKPEFWQTQRTVMETAKELLEHFGEEAYHDFNAFEILLTKALKELKLKLSASDKKQLIQAIGWKNEEAERVIKKKEKDGTIVYEADSELRDSENVPLQEDIDVYFAREVAPHVPDAWIDYSKTTIGYEISFTKYFYKYQPLRGLDEITEDLWTVEKESEGLLRRILSQG